MIASRVFFTAFSVLVMFCLVPSSRATEKQNPSIKKEWWKDPNATQGDLNTSAYADYKKADAQLNSIYRQILAKNKGDKVFIDKFIKAEKAWLVFRDAQLEARFPLSADPDNYGSAFPMCRAVELTSLTNDRIKQLKPWLEGVAEGDVCLGSFRSSHRGLP